MRLLVVAAHPDDETLGCGATIARHAANGDEVSVLVLGEGITSRARTRDEDALDREALRNLRTVSERAIRQQGAARIHFEALPDNRFDTVPLLEIVKFVEEMLEISQPERVYTHHSGDLNVDHELTFRAVLTATRPMPGTSVRDLYTFEVPSSTDWAFQRFDPPFRPNVFVDVTQTLQSKLEAMAIYEGEIRPFPHPRSTEALIANARRWGSVVGLAAVEAFELVRSVRVKDV
jgi:LmbE family N-acetylglucosaminyl deacetylase